MSPMVVKVGEAPADSVPPSWGKHLQKIEARVGASETEGLRARWEFGQELLAQRHGLKLPDGLLAAIAQEVGTSRAELQKRVKFAATFSTEEALRNAITQFPSWYQMVREGIVTKRQSSTARKVDNTSLRLIIKQLRRALPKVHAADLNDSDLKALDAIQEELSRIYDEISAAPKAVAK